MEEEEVCVCGGVGGGGGELGEYGGGGGEERDHAQGRQSDGHDPWLHHQIQITSAAFRWAKSRQQITSVPIMSVWAPERGDESLFLTLSGIFTQTLVLCSSARKIVRMVGEEVASFTGQSDLYPFFSFLRLYVAVVCLFSFVETHCWRQMC